MLELEYGKMFMMVYEGGICTYIKTITKQKVEVIQ